MITIWDSGDLAYTGTGVQLSVGSPPSLPQGSTYADRFGMLQVEVRNPQLGLAITRDWYAVPW